MTSISSLSGRRIIEGWSNIVDGESDAIEIQFDIDSSDLNRKYACIMLEYWSTPENLVIESILTIDTIKASSSGWCVFLPKMGRLLIHAIDLEPRPVILASQWINIPNDVKVGTVVNIRVDFPDYKEKIAANLKLNS